MFLHSTLTDIILWVFPISWLSPSFFLGKYIINFFKQKVFGWGRLVFFYTHTLIDSCLCKEFCTHSHFHLELWRGCFIMYLYSIGVKKLHAVWFSFFCKWSLCVFVFLEILMIFFSFILKCHRSVFECLSVSLTLICLSWLSSGDLLLA